MRNNFIDTFKSFKSSFIGANIKPCFCYCRTWFHENYHNGKFLVLHTDEVEKFRQIKGNDFDVLMTNDFKVTYETHNNIRWKVVRYKTGKVEWTPNV